MIVVDASAIVAILLQEPDAPVFSDALAAEADLLISASSVLECSMTLQSRLGIGQDTELDELLADTGIVVTDIDAEQLACARRAWGLYGKSLGHPAKLNFGDCFSYALAKVRGAPLLFKGNDFTHTDITSAL
jgi:ribonuclease VapC